MAVEAVSQIHMIATPTDEIIGFTLRNVRISAALQIPDDDSGIETILDLSNPMPGDPKISSKWFRFVISSSTIEVADWKENCSGWIRVECSITSQYIAISNGVSNTNISRFTKATGERKSVASGICTILVHCILQSRLGVWGIVSRSFGA